MNFSFNKVSEDFIQDASNQTDANEVVSLCKANEVLAMDFHEVPKEQTESEQCLQKRGNIIHCAVEKDEESNRKRSKIQCEVCSKTFRESRKLIYPRRIH